MTTEEILQLRRREQDKKDDKIVMRIKEYIDEYGPANFSEMVKYTRSDYKTLKRLIEEGRVEIVEDIDELGYERMAQEEKLKKLNALNELKNEFQRGNSPKSRGMYSKDE